MMKIWITVCVVYSVQVNPLLSSARYIYEIYNRSTDWKTANELCEMIGSEDLCNNGICQADKIKDLLPNHNFTDTHVMWVQIVWHWLDHECLPYYYENDQHAVSDPDFQKLLGAIYLEKNSPAHCANECGFGINAVYLWEKNCYCNNTGLKKYDVVPDKSKPVKNASDCPAKCPGSHSHFCGRVGNPENYPIHVSKYSIYISDYVNKPWNYSVGEYCVAAKVSIQRARFVRVHDCNMKKTTVCKHHSETPTPVTDIVTRMWTTEALGTDGASSAVYVMAALLFLIVICLIVISLLLLKRRRLNSTQNVILERSNDENIDQRVSILLSPIPPTSTQDNVYNDDIINSNTTANTLELNDEANNSAHTEVEGQYDDLNDRPLRNSKTSKDNAYEHADITSRDMTYCMTDSHRRRKSNEICSDSVYDHTNDTATYDVSEELTIEGITENEYEYTTTGVSVEPFNVKQNQ